ncbi:GAF domain-containing protein [Nocardia mexicana]|uniref:GAF domain-containing protein n=1 Tax=Nocardia mexicana TaxID=279262 RepID=A0A370HDK5_9NOCA|nr:GAF domain-containing protein [Nocardia mexicana]RDI54495.1 GAF domain-containing protein [Nocardia mexicana]
MRSDVRASWDRARRRGLHPNRHLPQVVLTADELREYRENDPMGTVLPTLLTSLDAAASEPGHILFVGDAQGHLLWVRGDASTRRVAERANLVSGARWSEAGAGTNGVGTALALGKPFQVRGAEHYLSLAMEFTCTAAPIRDPATGAVIGVVDVTCRRQDARAMALPLVTAAARLAEAHLADLYRRRDAEARTRYVDRISARSPDWNALLSVDGRVLHAEPAGWLPTIWPGALVEGPATLPDGRPVVLERLSQTGMFAVRAPRRGVLDTRVAHVTALGRDRALLDLDGAVHQLSARHSELVVLLLAHPEGITAAALAEQVYGSGGKVVTVRAELARLRRILGYRLIANPYRIDPSVTADFQQPGDRAAGRTVLPSSQAPGIIRLRHRFDRGDVPFGLA